MQEMKYAGWSSVYRWSQIISSPESYRIGLVGPCAAGKSTLIYELRQRGYNVKHIAQEHSYVRDMWQRLTNPDVLIYLDVSYPISCQRRNMDWNEAEYQVQVKRLEHARQNADYYLNTDELSIDQVLEHILNYLAKFS